MALRSQTLRVTPNSSKGAEMIAKMSRAIALRRVLQRLEQKHKRQGLLLEDLRKSIYRQERSEKEPPKREQP